MSKQENKMAIAEKRRWWKNYLLPSGTPKQIARNGLIIMVPMFVVSQIVAGVIGDLAGIFTAYGEILLVVALILWIKTKIQKAQ